MQYFNSGDIKVFPCQRRDNEFDRESLLNTEFNLTNMINRLTDIKSFIIDGLELNGTFLSHGECNIGGYYFKIINDIDITNMGLTGSPTNSKLVFKIDLVTENVPYGAELSGKDEAVKSNKLYKGLSLEVAPSNTITNDKTLVIADWVNGGWVSHTQSHLKYNAKSINIKPSDLDKTYMTDSESNLIDALKNIIIDDGEL